MGIAKTDKKCYNRLSRYKKSNAQNIFYNIFYVLSIRRTCFY